MTIHANTFQGLELQITAYNLSKRGTQFKGLWLPTAGSLDSFLLELERTSDIPLHRR